MSKVLLQEEQKLYAQAFWELMDKLDKTKNGCKGVTWAERVQVFSRRTEFGLIDNLINQPKKGSSVMESPFLISVIPMDRFQMGLTY